MMCWIFPILSFGISVVTANSFFEPLVVKLDNATFTGVYEGPLLKFLGIPYAQPPIADLRFRLPQSLPPYNGSHLAINSGPSCPQLGPGLPVVGGNATNWLNDLNSTFSILADVVFGPISEDCLTIDIIKPANIISETNLPVVVWFIAGGFEYGSSSMLDGGVIVQRSIELNEPIIYVSMNFRQNAFGFLASQQVKDAGVGNIGLYDQRLALRWVQKYIAAFGGDPTRVTIWGDSAGAISAALQMLTNGGNSEGLFRAAFMQSGSSVPLEDITRGQAYYDDIVSRTNCGGFNDTLACLRTIPYDDLQAAIDNSPRISSYQSAQLAWLPRVDGVFLTKTPTELVDEDSVAQIPFISGNCDDEGTFFSFANSNVTTDSEFREYITQYWLSTTNSSVIDSIMELYPSNITLGSPFDTGSANALTPQFKRLAAFQGDIVFHGPRRYFVQQRAQSGKQKVWSYLSKRLKWLPYLGSAHASDVLNVYGPGDMTDYLIRFVVNLDPNVGSQANAAFYWPEYTLQDKQLLTFLDDVAAPLAISTDTYRSQALSYVSKVESTCCV
ncbi:Alpha/Beta hydrolase protein, partial [Hygrophoropsis aurantiaca]